MLMYMCKMFKKFIEFLRGLFGPKYTADEFVVTENPEAACEMQEHKVYVEEYPMVKDDCLDEKTCGYDVCTSCEQSADNCTCCEDPDIKTTPEVVTPKKHRGRPRKKKASK